MADVRETKLPGVGVRHDFTTDDGRDVGVLVHRDGRRAYVYVPDGSEYAQRQVRTGGASELLIEVRDGPEGGDSVLLREPPANRITQRLEAEDESPPAAARRRGRPSGGGKPAEAAASKGSAVRGG